jgi:UDP-arabinose 4-epimerase
MANDSSRTVLVTGGAGFVGAHACKALARHGFTPVVYDNLGHGHEVAVRWGPLEVGEIGDRERLDSVIGQYQPSAIMHFAAFIAVGESVADPGKYYRNNVAGSLTLLEAARDHGIGAFVFSSTAAVYGLPDRVPIPETAPKQPINPYGETKLVVENMLRDFGAAHGLRSTALRYFNAAGADPDGEIGERHDPETHLIPLALDAVSGRGPPLTLYGEDYDTADGTCVRDYIHVADLAEAHVKALEALLGGAESGAFNLGTGQGFTVRQVLDAIERVTGRPVPHQVGPRRPGDPAALVSDPGRAMAELGWAPRLSDIDSIVSTAWAWHRKSNGGER